MPVGRRTRDSSRLGQLGTAYGLVGQRPFHGRLDVLVPSEEDQAVVHRIIYDELCVGVVREESRDEYRRVIRSLVDDGAEGVIYGCTEIELLVGPGDSPVPSFPTTRLHVEAAVERALADEPVRRPELP